MEMTTLQVIRFLILRLMSVESRVKCPEYFIFCIMCDFQNMLSFSRPTIVS